MKRIWTRAISLLLVLLFIPNVAFAIPRDQEAEINVNSGEELDYEISDLEVTGETPVQDDFAVLEIISQEPMVIEAVNESDMFASSNEALPDIRLSNLTQPAGTTLPSDTSIEYVFDIANYGTAPTPSSIPLSVYVAGTCIGTTTVEGPIESGYGIKVAILIRVNVVGDRVVTLWGNEDKAIEEVDYNNNTVSQAFKYINKDTAVDVAANRIEATGFFVTGNQIECGEFVTFEMDVANYSQSAQSVPVILLFNGSKAIEEVVALEPMSITQLSVNLKFNRGNNVTATLQVDPENTSNDWNMTNNEASAFYRLIGVSSTLEKSVDDSLLFTTVAINGDTPGGVMNVIAVRAPATVQAYYQTTDDFAKIDQLMSTIYCDTKLFNPEICTYTCKVARIVVRSGSATEEYLPNENQALSLPSGYIGESKSKTFSEGECEFNLPIEIEYYYTMEWFDNCAPLAGVQSIKMQIEE